MHIDDQVEFGELDFTSVAFATVKNRKHQLRNFVKLKVVVSHQIGFENTFKRLLLTASFSISIVKGLADGVNDVGADLLVLGLHLGLEILQSVFILFEMDKVFPM